MFIKQIQRLQKSFLQINKFRSSFYEYNTIGNPININETTYQNNFKEMSKNNIMKKQRLNLKFRINLKFISLINKLIKKI